MSFNVLLGFSLFACKPKRENIVMINPFGSVYGVSTGAPNAPITALPVSHNPNDPSGLYLSPFNDAYGHHHADDAYTEPFVHRFDELPFLPLIPFLGATGLVLALSGLGLLLPGGGGRRRVAEQGGHWFSGFWNRGVPNIVNGNDIAHHEGKLLLGDAGKVRAHQRLSTVSNGEQLAVQSHLFKTQGGRNLLTDTLDSHEKAMHKFGLNIARHKQRRQTEAFHRAIRDLGLMENDKKAKAHGFQDAMDARLHYVRCLVSNAEAYLCDTRNQSSFSASNMAFTELERIATTPKLRQQLEQTAQYQAVYDQVLLHNSLLQGMQQLRTGTAPYSIDKAQSKINELAVRATHEPQLLGPVRKKWLEKIQSSPEFKKFDAT